MTHTVRVLLLGAPQVGKTQLISKLLNEQPYYHYLTTSGVDRHYLHRDGIRFSLYDAGGLQKYAAIVRSYYQTPNIVALSFSFDKPDSLIQLESYYQEVSHVNPKALFILLELRSTSSSLSSRTGQSHKVQSFLNRHNIQRFIQCNTGKKEDLIYIENELHQMAHEQQHENCPVRHSATFDALWQNNLSMIKNIENILLPPQPKKKFSQFFEFKQDEKRKGIICILTPYQNSQCSPAMITCLFEKLMQFNQTHHDYLERPLAYLSDKLALPQQEIMRHTTPHNSATIKGPLT